MNTKLVNSAAGVINAALGQDRTAAGIALALESAQLLTSPETVAESERLRKQVDELEAAAYGDATVRLLTPIDQIRHLHAAVAAQMSRADTLDRLCREKQAETVETQRLRGDNELLRLNHTQIQTAMNKMSADLGEALRDADEDLPLLRMNLQGWSERGRKAEAELKSARIRAAELEARAVAGLGSVWWLSQYEGVEPELFATEAAAREFCDEQAAGELDGWDWFPDGDGVFRQWRTSDLDDRPLSEGPGSVTRLLAPAQPPREDAPEAGVR